MGASQPAPALGTQLNQEFQEKMSKSRQARRDRWDNQSSQLFQTLLNSGQKPYSSPYEPPDLFSPMSKQNTGYF
jgi:hypothetical protein